MKRLTAADRRKTWDYHRQLFIESSDIIPNKYYMIIYDNNDMVISRLKIVQSWVISYDEL